VHIHAFVFRGLFKVLLVSLLYGLILFFSCFHGHFKRFLKAISVRHGILHLLSPGLVDLLLLFRLLYCLSHGIVHFLAALLGFLLAAEGVIDASGGATGALCDWKLLRWCCPHGALNQLRELFFLILEHQAQGLTL
jgi:hypothetical protein